MRLLVTGSRNWDDKPGKWGDQPGIVAGVLGVIAAEIAPVYYRRTGDGVTLIHGCCPDSPDILADTAARQLGWQVEPHPADWIRYGKQAGFIRNREMVATGADLGLAFIAACVKPGCVYYPKPHDSHGAADCAGQAEQAGITVWRYQQ